MSLVFSVIIMKNHRNPLEVIEAVRGEVFPLLRDEAWKGDSFTERGK